MKFDNRLHLEKCNSNRGFSLHIDSQSFERKLIDQVPEIPTEVKLENGECTVAQGLYCKSGEMTLQKEITSLEVVRGNEMNTDVNRCNVFLNANFSIEQINAN